MRCRPGVSVCAGLSVAMGWLTLTPLQGTVAAQEPEVRKPLAEVAQAREAACDGLVAAILARAASAPARDTDAAFAQSVLAPMAAALSGMGSVVEVETLLRVTEVAAPCEWGPILELLYDIAPPGAAPALVAAAGRCEDAERALGILGITVCIAPEEALPELRRGIARELTRRADNREIVPDLRFLDAMCQGRAGDCPGAAAAFDRLKTHPFAGVLPLGGDLVEVDVALRAATLHERAGNRQAAIDSARTCLPLPWFDDVSACRHTARAVRLLREAGRDDEAATELRLFPRPSPRDPSPTTPAAIAIARAWEAVLWPGQPAEEVRQALQCAGELRRRPVASAYTIQAADTLAAAAALRIGDLDAAERGWLALRQGQQRRECRAMAALGLALVYCERGNQAQARTWWQEGRDLRPDHLWCEELRRQLGQERATPAAGSGS